jgi:hypothetical protein
MLLGESSGALGSPGVISPAMLMPHALKPGHAFNRGTFIDGTMPPQTEVPLKQTLVSLR